MRRVGHDVLGPTPEWSRLVLTLPDGRRAEAALPAPRIFEDLAPRPVALPGGGLAVAVVESTPTLGARYALWSVSADPSGPRIAPLAATPPIGRSFRWLAPAGAGDLDGDGRLEIAYVETPHLRGLLRVWRLDRGALTELAAQEGFSNHRIGADWIDGAQRACAEGQVLVLPDRPRRRWMAVRLAGGALQVAPLPGPGPDAGGDAPGCPEPR